MALKSLNSVGGFSVGEVPANVIYANGDFSGNKANFSGNVAVLGLLTNNLYYANGSAWDLQQAAGSNTQIQYNNNNDFGASANFTFNSATNVLTVSNGNVSTGNLIASGLLSVTGNATAGNVYANSGTIGASLLTGTLTTAAQPNITSTGVLSNLVVANTIYADGYAARTGSDLTLSTAGNGNLIISVAGTGITNFSGKPVSNISNLSATGTLSVTGNANVGNIGAAAGVFTANVTAANIYANSGTIGASLLTGTLVTAAQPNVTSVGTLTGLTVNGVTNLGANGNVIITGGTSGQFLQTNGSGNLSWVTVGTSGISNGTSGVSVPVSNGNIVANVNGSTVLTVASSGANITGYANVTGNANVGNLGTAGLITATGNVSGGNLTTGGALSVTGNANVGNIGAAAGVFTGTLNVTGNANVGNIGAGAVVATTVAGSLTTASQPNVTSVGTLTSLAVTGNVAAGNLTTTGVLTVSGTGVSSIAGNLDMTSNNIINLATPVNSTDAATKQYVDDVAQGLNIHDSCGAATPDTLANITGGTITYNNGSSGVGATLTVSGGTYGTIDGVNVATVGTRILVKNEANAVYNGIYTYTSSTVLTRATDYDSVPEVEAGDFVFVTGGTLYDNTGWVQTSTVTAIGTAGNTIDFTQFSGAGTYTAGTGLTLSGSQFSITNTAVSAGSYGNGDRVASFTVNSQGQLTAASNTVIAANAANLTGTTLASSIVNSSLTSVGTLTSLTVTGNASAGNISTGGVLSVTGNANVGNLGTSGLITATGNITGGNITTAGLVSTATLSASGNANVGNLGTSGLIVATGNITGGNLVTAGALSVTGNANVGNIGAASGVLTGNLSVTGNISGNNFSGNTLTASSNVIVGTTGIRTGTVTTTAITANQTIATLSVTGITGVEFLVKGVDSSGSKYTVATVTAVTDGSSVDYSTFGGVTLGATTGTLAVNISGGNIALQVTPASTNTTVWTTQYRTI